MSAENAPENTQYDADLHGWFGGAGSFGGRFMPEALIAALDGVALHAAGLAFLHPATGERIELTAPTPPRIERLLAHLREARAAC